MPYILRVCLVPPLLVFVTQTNPTAAETGYGYKRGKDPLILEIKRIVLAARTADWDRVSDVTGKLEWQFKEFRDDLSLDLEPAFRAAVASKSLARLSREISTVIYFAIVQKFHWNEREQLKKFVRSKSRLDAALYYYEEILSIGVRKFDERHKEELHRRILDAFTVLRRSIGSSGLLGFQARPPELREFKTRRNEVEALLRKVYPHVTKYRRRESSGKTTPPTAGSGSPATPKDK